MSEANAEEVLKPTALGKRGLVLNEESLSPEEKPLEPPKKARSAAVSGMWSQFVRGAKTGTKPMSEEHLDTVKDAVDKALAALNEHAGDKEVLIHLGIGVGDPGATFGEVDNPSVNLPTGVAEAQVNPPCLEELQREGRYVVALNFNLPDPDAPLRPYEPANGIHLQVPAAFPLDSGSRSAQALEALGRLTAKRQVVVLNCVEQNPYRSMVGLVSANGWYVSSYFSGPARVVRRMGIATITTEARMADPELLVTPEPD